MKKKKKADGKKMECERKEEKKDEKIYSRKEENWKERGIRRKVK